jgi:glycosyltransferase involved in cell wall biosynthesis
MRVCLYTHTALPLIGGQEFVVDALARQFQHLGHDVVVLAPRPSRARFWTLPPLPYPVVRHPRFLSTRRLVSWYRWWLLRCHRRHAFDVVHCHGIYPAGYLAALCRERLGCPLVITSHGEDLPSTSHQLGDPELRRRHVQALEHADALIAISRFTSAGIGQLCPGASGRIVYLPNGVAFESLGVPMPRPAGLDPAIQPKRFVLFMGRLEPRKGVKDLLAALALLPEDGRLQLVIAGDGKQRPFLEGLAAELRLGRRLRFLGMVQGSVKTYLLQNALALAAPSVGWEGQPLIILESYAARLPVIVSDLPGFADMVRPDQTGWLVPSQSPAALAEALGQVFADPTEAARRGERGRAFAQQYGWSAVAQRHLQLYEALRTARYSRRSA